ncbi:MAG: iron uptake system component EfeO, partial [Alpinimonas sp.]
TSTLLAFLLAGCVPNTPESNSDAITVDSSADACTLSTATAPSGNIHFAVTNSGSQVTEFYILAEDGLRIVGEVENVGPDTSRDLVIQASPGTYYTVCKPGMVGTGIGNTSFTVTDSGTKVVRSADVQAAVDTAAANYAAYVRNEIDLLVAGTEAFAASYVSGDLDTARSLYPSTRMHWERVETVAESFGDLDPKLDLREADLEEGQEWTGWHAIEKDLWPADAEPDFTAYDQPTREHLSALLIADTSTLQAKVQDLSFTLPQLTNGAIGLLDEVATGKVTGEEEAFSHTDLWDFQANVDGARVLFGGVREMLVAADPTLTERLDREFKKLQVLLDAQRVGDGFRLYTELSPKEIKALADQVNALGEPLNLLTAALVLR